jgi:hypothetical protein
MRLALRGSNKAPKNGKLCASAEKCLCVYVFDRKSLANDWRSVYKSREHILD